MRIQVGRRDDAVQTPYVSWKALEYQGVPLMPEGFALSTTGQTADAQMQLGVAGAGLHATVNAHADWSRAWQVAVTAAVPPTTLADTEMLRGMTRKFAGRELSITGQVSATVSALLAEDRPSTVRISAAVTNFDVGCAAEKWQVSGLATHVTADGPRAWRTPQGEVLTFQAAKKGDVVVDGGAIRWQFRREALLVEQADFNWCDGMLHSYGLSLDLRDPRLETDLYAERIELARLMAQTKVLQGSGTGRLFGRMPIRVENGELHFARSYLYSTPGEGGMLKLSNVDLIDLALEQGKVAADTRRQVCGALRNLKYSVFRTDLTGGSDNATLGLHVEGREAGNTVDRPVDLNVNLNAPLDELFNLGMEVSRKLK